MQKPAAIVPANSSNGIAYTELLKIKRNKIGDLGFGVRSQLIRFACGEKKTTEKTICNKMLDAT